MFKEDGILHITRLNIGYLFYPGMNWIEKKDPQFRVSYGYVDPLLRVPEGKIDPPNSKILMERLILYSGIFMERFILYSRT